MLEDEDLPKLRRAVVREVLKDLAAGERAVIIVRSRRAKLELIDRYPALPPRFVVVSGEPH